MSRDIITLANKFLDEAEKNTSQEERKKNRQKIKKQNNYIELILYIWHGKDEIKYNNLWLDWYKNHKPICPDKTRCTCKEWEAVYIRRMCPTEYGLAPLSDFKSIHQSILGAIDGGLWAIWSRISFDGTTIE